MDTLMLVNTLVIGAMFAIWEKKNWLNMSIKLILMALAIFNILRLAGKF